VDSRERRALALWESLAYLGMPVAVVGWPVASPFSPGLRFAVSDGYFAGLLPAEETVPADLAERAPLFRPAPEELEEDLPAVADRAGRREALGALSGDLWRAALAGFLVEQEELGAVFVVLPGLHRVAERYGGGYHAVQFEGLQGAPYEEAAALLEAYYARLDAALAVLWLRGERPGLLAVVSQHGTAAPSGWRRVGAELSSKRSLAGQFRPAPDGILLLYGDGVRPGNRLAGGRLVDLVPTLLYGLGLPVARDLDGQVLLQAFEPAHLGRQPLSFVPTYESLRPPAPAPGAGG
jgi:hypothetical protein